MLREQISWYYGEDAKILTTRRLRGRGASLFVVDFSFRRRLVRMLGTIDGKGDILEHSAMDLLRPERLVFVYERLMAIALALVEAPRRALLLGLGGGAMLRHLAAFLPDCAPTVVEREPAVIELARRYFNIAQPVQEGDAADFVADARGYDVVMVDLYDADGAVGTADDFWRDCAAALRPGGIVAINWAGFLEAKHAGAEIGRVAALFGRCFYLRERGPRPNLIQFAPTAADFDLAALPARWRRFALRHALPREARDVLMRAEILSSFPPRAATRRARG